MPGFRTMNVQRDEIFQANHALDSAWLDHLLHSKSIPLWHVASFIPASGKGDYETLFIRYHSFCVFNQ